VSELLQDCKWEQVNPKAITADELYGTIEKAPSRSGAAPQSPAVAVSVRQGEWKDGAVSVIMRNMSKARADSVPADARAVVGLSGAVGRR